MTRPVTRGEFAQFAELMNSENKRLSEEDNRQNHRIEKLEEGVSELWELAGAIKELAANMKNMVEEQKRQGERLDSLERQDGDMWKTVVKCAVTAVVSGLVAYVLFKLGLKG